MPLAHDWRARGLIGEETFRRLDEVESGRLFSLHREIRALMYLGALCVLAGTASTVARYFKDLGEASVVAALLLGIALCWGYCFRRAAPYACGRVESPTAAYDYLLYLGCALLGVLFGYLEKQHGFLKDHWDYYLLVSGLLFFALAYRHDNRFVLGLALLNVGGWWGMRIWDWGADILGWRFRALTFGAACLAAAWESGRRGVKAHFEDAYSTVGVHAAFWGLLPGAAKDGFAGVSLYAVLAGSAACVALALRRRRLAYFVYGVGYGYWAFSSSLMRLMDLRGDIVSYYYLLSGAGVIAALLAFRRRLQEDAA